MTQREPSADYHHVQGLERGLAVLRELNRHPAGVGAVDVAQATGLNRSTAKRLLETLCALGYSQKLADGLHYVLTYRVMGLSEAFNQEADICLTARPLLEALTRRILWPSSIATLEGDHMVVRFSTHPHSPLSFQPGTVQQLIPLLPTSVGRAFLAFCTDEVREPLLKILGLQPGLTGELARDAHRLRPVLEATRQRGYAMNDGEGSQHPHIASIAAPVIHEGRVMACINLMFTKRALAAKSGAERYAMEVLATARDIERAYAQAMAKSD